MGLVRAIYRNTILTTVVLVFLYLLIDKAVPFILQSVVMGLSRLRMPAAFVVRKVKA